MAFTSTFRTMRLYTWCDEMCFWVQELDPYMLTVRNSRWPSKGRSNRWNHEEAEGTWHGSHSINRSVEMCKVRTDFRTCFYWSQHDLFQTVNKHDICLGITPALIPILIFCRELIEKRNKKFTRKNVVSTSTVWYVALPTMMIWQALSMPKENPREQQQWCCWHHLMVSLMIGVHN